MKALDAIRGRRSVRAFLGKDVSQQDIEVLLEAASYAPSAGNLQSRSIVLVRDPGQKKLLSSAALGQGFVSTAPVVFVFCANKERAARYGGRGRDLYSIQDASIAAGYLVLAAHELGLGSCWVGAFDEDEVSRVLSLPGYVRPVAIVPVGYPDERPTSPRRKPDVHTDSW